MEFLHASVTMRVPGVPGGQPMILNLHVDPQVAPQPLPFSEPPAGVEMVAGAPATGMTDQASQPQGFVGGPLQSGNFDGHRIQNLVKLGETVSPYILALLALFGVKVPPLPPFPPIPGPNPPAPQPAA